MTIVPIGSLILQAAQGEDPLDMPELCAVLCEQIRGVIERCIEEILEADVDHWLERKRYERRKRSRRQKVKMRCSRCLSHQRQNFRRNGHYRRHLNTGWGRVLLNVPQVKCVCGGNVQLRFRAFRCRQRIWDDLELDVRIEYGRGLSYRQIKADWDQRLGGSVGLRSLNGRVLATAGEGMPAQPLQKGQVPPVMRVDGIWITVMFPTGQVQKDRLGRTRLVKQAKKVPILAAQGVWPLTGRTVLLAWVRADSEDSTSWQKFLEQLYEAGITPENGLALLVADGSPGFQVAYQNLYWMVPLQRCVFHKLRNVASAVRIPSNLDRQTARLYRTQFLRQAARIWQAPDATEARLLYTAFCQQWRADQPKAIATLARDFEDTLTFYAVQEQAAARGQDWPAHLLRTTSPLERCFREFRRRYRNAILFYSEAGARAATAQLASRFS